MDGVAGRPRRQHRRLTRRTYLWRRLWVATAALALLGGLVTAGVWAASALGPRTPPPQSGLGVAAAPFTTVGRITVPTPGYRSPTAQGPDLDVSSSWGGAPTVVPVLAFSRRRFEVQLAGQAPTQQRAWVPQGAIRLRRTPYLVVVDLDGHRLLVLRRGRPTLCAAAAVGAPPTPTPTGHYYVAFLARSPSPAYGPFVVVTSALTTTVTDWEQSGTPVVTINGPLSSAAALAAGGGADTTGSIRLAERDLLRLRPVPPGSPFDVVRSLQPAGSLPRRLCRLGQSR